MVAKEYGAVFLIGIGGELADGKPHDGRAPDYDDWTSPSEAGYKGLNGDILVWNEALGSAFELSSMGIRVDEEALKRQVAITGDEDRLEFDWHRALLNGLFRCLSVVVLVNPVWPCSCFVRNISVKCSQAFGHKKCAIILRTFYKRLASISFLLLSICYLKTFTTRLSVILRQSMIYFLVKLKYTEDIMTKLREDIRNVAIIAHVDHGKQPSLMNY